MDSQELCDIGGEFAWIFPQFTTEVASHVDPSQPADEKTIENDHKKQEEVLRRYISWLDVFVYNNIYDIFFITIFFLSNVMDEYAIVNEFLTLVSAILSAIFSSQQKCWNMGLTSLYVPWSSGEGF